ncbi:MAG TPA: nucleotidyltransferase family protein [Thiobacillaceae bacterium]|nr:nucleotidyltransferase family protein [Thiobacillaceae bacterium]HNU65029.1 nucleotidyltransferase family protein [Thiobacillaceae bacterium]
MKPACDDLLGVLIDPRHMAMLDLAAWDRLLPQARQAGLLSRLALQAADLRLTPPAPVAAWFQGARSVAERQLRAVGWEARKLDQALARLGHPVLLLKGAAYAVADLPPARGRIFSDIDILLPKAALEQAEGALRLHGWHGHHHSAYDQRYYRRWMHELPPLVHIRRQTTLDVHHNLLPETARLHTHPQKIIAAARPLPGFQVLRLPCLADLALHSATHLFHEGEWRHGLRDLVDLDALLRHGALQADWWDGLWRRARELRLEQPLALALRYAQRLLRTPVPDTLLEAAQACHAKPLWPLRDALFMRGFGAFHGACHRPGQALAEFALFVRAHALRMPPHLLLPHLGYKAWLALRGAEPETS